jgi:superfamily II DNA/RNA helicase
MPAAAIVQRAIEVDVDKRSPLLRRLLQDLPQALVFVKSQYGADHLVSKLNRHGITARPLHGGLSQGARTQALAAFKANEIKVLVGTDLAARGLDIVELPAVVNYDLPRSTTDYLHRIGRTGRAGEPGLAISLITVENAAHFRLIEKRYGLTLERERIAGFEPTATVLPAAPLPRDSHGGVKGKRRSKKDKLREAAAAQAERTKGGKR